MMVFVHIVFCVALLFTWEQREASLVVTLRDAANAPIVAAKVTAATPNDRVLQSHATDQAGQARFAALSARIVLVHVVGSLSDGTPLTLTGDDQNGIRVRIDGPTRLDLRVEPNGQVLPDPTTMLALERFGTGHTAADRSFDPAQPIATPPPASLTPVAQAATPRVPVEMDTPASTNAPAQQPLFQSLDTNGPYAVMAAPLCLVALGLLSGVGFWMLLRRRR